MGSLRTEHGGKLEVSRVHSRGAVCSSGKVGRRLANGNIRRFIPMTHWQRRRTSPDMIYAGLFFQRCRKTLSWAGRFPNIPIWGIWERTIPWQCGFSRPPIECSSRLGCFLIAWFSYPMPILRKFSHRNSRFQRRYVSYKMENTLQSLRCRVLPYIWTLPRQWNRGLLSLNAVHSYGKMHKFCPCHEDIFIGTMFGKTEYGIRCFAQKVFFFFQGVLPGKIGFYVTESPAIF